MSSQLQISDNFTKAISCLCFVFGAAQTILLGLIPKIAMVTNLDITSIIIIYGFSIFFFLFMTKEWAALFSKLKAKTIYRIAQFGLLMSNLALLATFTSGNVRLSLIFFVISRIIYALSASSIIPFSQIVKIGRYKDTHSGILETTIFLNAGRLVGLVLGGLLAFNLNLSLVVLIVMLLLTIPFDFKSGINEIQTIAGKKDSDTKQLIMPLLFIPLIYTFMTSFFHTSITSVVGDILIGQIKQSATIYWLLTLASLVIILTQLILKKLKLINSKIFSTLAIVSLLFSFYSFSRVNSLETLYGFILLFSFGAAIIPILYMGHIYNLNPSSPKQIVASEISFYQTLGNALGAIMSGVIIKYNFTNYILFLFVALVVGAISISFKYSTSDTREELSGATNG
ncbi:hypothetical protein ABMA70_14045 [Halobacteriovorax sp. XZX-3]|uniref:hypothetical protein n=1 Tax=unclassified Halobacteriovorax TaxID=2639665 RepID=UPI00372354B5